MSFGFSLNKTTQKKAIPKTGSFGFSLKKEEVKEVPKPTPQESTVRTVSLKNFLGGGEYKVDKPGEVVKTERGYANLPTKSGYERDHKVSVALGGTSSAKNLHYLQNIGDDQASRQAGKVAVELEAIKKYQDGQISLGEARAEIATKNQQILGLTPTPEEQTVKGQLKIKLDKIKSKLGFKVEEPVKKNYGLRDYGELKYTPQQIVEPINKEEIKTSTPTTVDYGTKEALIDAGKYLYSQAKKPITNAIAHKNMTEEEAKAVVMEKTIGKKGVESKIETLNKVLSMYNPEAEPVKDLIEYDKTLETLTPEQKNLVKAEEKAEGAFKVAQIPTAPIRFLAGFPAVAIISYALEKADSDASLNPDDIKNEDNRDIMKLLAGDTEVKRLLASDDLYGIVARSGAGMAGAVALMAILENPFVAGTGASLIVKNLIKKQGAEYIAKLGAKEFLKLTENAIKAELKAGKISKEMAEVALKEIGLPKSLAKGLDSEITDILKVEPKEIKPKTDVKPEPPQKPQEARGEPITKKTDILPSKEKVVKSEPIKEPVKKLDSLNPTGSVFAKYTPEQRAVAELADNITTLDKTSGKKADEVITIYRGVSDGNKKIVAGDFITTNKQLAKDYAGNGVVVEKKVKMSDILDDVSEPLGEEYIYRPKQSKIAELAKEEKASNIVINKAKEKAEKAVLPKLKKESVSPTKIPETTKPPIKKLEVKSPAEEALEQEAKKYKSADEFIKAQGTPVYHGTQAKFDKFDSKFATDAEGRKLNLGWGKGNFYFTTKKGEALKYATRERSPEVAKLYPKGEPNVIEAIVDIKKPFDMEVGKNAERWRKVRDGYWSDGISDFNYHKIPKGKTKAEAFVEQLKKEGYDGIIDGQEITAFSEKSIKTKSQLIDIWNKANNKTPLKPSTDNLINEAKKYKSAEEFVKAQGTPVYHGGAGVDELSKSVKILSPEDKLKYPSSGGGYIGLSTSPDKSYAQQYSRQIAGRDDVAELFIQPNAKIKNINGAIDDMSANELEKLSKKFDVLKSVEDNEFRILNENIVKTKSQLTDIWNKANKTVKNINVENIILGRDNYEQYAKQYDTRRSKQNIRTRSGGPSKRGNGGSDVSNKTSKINLPKNKIKHKPVKKSADLRKKLNEKSILPKPKKSDIIKAKETPKTKIISKASEVKAKKEKEEFTSRVFERMQAENPELLKGDLKATKVHLDNESKKAIEIMERDKQAAYNLAMGREESSDVLGTSVNIAMTEKALEEGNNKLAAKLIKNRSLAQTRRGQELVAEKGSITDNSTSRYMKELLSNRLDKLGDKYTDGIKDILKKGSKKENAINKIEKEIANVEIAITNKKLDTKTALALLEKMTCI